jgi:hypothetical protein
MTSAGKHLGAVLAGQPDIMLGNLGRAPPTCRLILADEPSDEVRGAGPISLWTMIESPLDAVLVAHEREGAPERIIKARRGDVLRANADIALRFDAGVTAMEVSSSFTPNNASQPSRVQRLTRPDTRRDRAVVLRDAGLSVELWTLPEDSYLVPDGETCHVITAMTPGVVVDGRMLARGEAVFVPAEGRPVTLKGRGAQVLAAYPDVAPTTIWRRVRSPNPGGAARIPQMPGGFEGGVPLAAAPIPKPNTILRPGRLFVGLPAHEIADGEARIVSLNNGQRLSSRTGR